jgi:predicted XRE-type DNA-binding protein
MRSARLAASYAVHTPDPIPALKGQIAQVIVSALEGWSQEWAAELLRTDQPRISDLRNGRLERFSLEQLIRFAARIGGDVHLGVTWTKRKRLFRA